MSNDWIPCTEKLPEVGTKCLVTLENETIVKMQYGVWGWSAYPNNKVVAWQPLPRPYQVKEVK